MSLDMELLLDAVRRVESGGNANAVSPAGAKGPYQFMDATAKEYGVADPFDEKQSREGARRYLTDLMNQFGSVEKALAAYNGGPGRLAQNDGNIAAMPRESRDYVSKVMSHYQAGVITTTAGDHTLFPPRQPTPTVNTLFPGEKGLRRLAAGELFPINRENEALMQSVLNPPGVSEASRIYQLQLRTGLPTGLIERNLDTLEAQVKRADFDAEKFRAKSPLLAQWLAENPARAALAQDDYESLSTLEQVWQTMKAIPAGGEQGWKKQQSMILGYKAAAGTITPQEQLERRALDIELQQLSTQFSEGAPSWTKAAADVIGMQIPMLAESAKAGVLYGLPTGAAAGAALGAVGGSAGGPLAPGTIPAGALAGAAAGGVLGAKTVGSAKYIEQTYEMSVGEAYNELEKAEDADGNPIDPTVARYASMVVALPNALLEFASVRTALKAIPFSDQIIGKLTTETMKKILVRPSVMAALKDFGKRYAAAVGTETFTEGMQALMVTLAREIATGDLGEGVTAEDFESAGQQSFEAFKGSVVLGALASGPKVIELYADMQKADQNEQFMLALGDTTANSKTNANSSEAYGEYIEKLKENGPVKNVFIPIQQWDLLFQDQAPDAAKEVFGDLKQYTEAKTVGGDLVIPIETYAKKLAGTEFHAALIPDIRLAPGEMTPREADEAMQAEPEIVEVLKQELAQKEAEEVPLAAIYDDVFGKMREAGVSTQEANRVAIMEREHLRALAAYMEVDPLQLYMERPLQVQREAVREKLQVYNQQLAEPAVPTPQRLPLEGGDINLPPPTPEETTTAVEALAAAEQSNKDYGAFGATYHPTRGNLAGTEGVAVAGYPQRGVITEGPPTAEEIETFMRRNRDIFQADPNAALGLRVDSESGKGYIDITNVLPRDVAIAQGESLGEIAVWDLGAFEEIRLPVQRDTGQQMLFQGERGASVPARNLMVLFEGADPSTPIHELGHLWLEELRDYALRPDASVKLKQHWETVKAEVGMTDEAITVEQHEKFARSLEAYVMEGKSPSFQLSQVFSELLNWMLRIYKSAKMLDVNLSDEMRNVFDHLLATEDAIKQSREHHDYETLMFDDSVLTPEEAAAYNQLSEEAKATASNNFRAKVMKELRREKLQSWRDEKKALAPKVRAEILDQPIYRAAYWLWSGKLPDGSEVPGMAATKLDKQSLLDMGVTLSDLPFRYQENGLHPDVVAGLFGFPSGESLVKGLIGLPTLKDAIENEVNQRIREEHGGIIVEGTTMEEAAMEVQNTRQIDVFNMELRILKRLGARREKTHPAILKDIARKIIERKTLRGLNPRLYEEAAIKAGQEAQEALLGREFRTGTGRNLDIAYDAKQKQLLNILLFREATEKQKEANKSIKKWKRFLFRSDARLAQSYDMNMVNAARAIASVHGLGGAGDTAANYMKALREYDPETYNDMKGIVEMASSDGRKLDDLMVSEFEIVRDAIEGLWAQARRSKQVEIDGKRMEKADVIQQLNGRTAQLLKPGRKRAGYDRAVTKWDKTKMLMLGGKAMLRRVEFWVDAMDGGDHNGVYRRFIWNPISEAADAYRDHRRVMLEQYMALAENFPKESAKAGKIDAPELRYEFANKAELLGTLLHTGNESNFQKMLRGREWGAFVDGELDSSKWDTFIERMWKEGVLTKADYEFVQGVWDLFEEMKPQAQKIHKEVYGYYFSEVTAQPIKTPFGVFRGGYYPARVDPFIVEDAAIRQEQEAVEMQPSSFLFPSPAVGFTKHRNEQYAKPLSLDIGLITQNIETELKFIHLKKPTRDIGRVAIDKDFRSMLSALDSEVGSIMLVPWLQRSAMQIVEIPSGPKMRQLDAFAHAIRTRTGLQFMAVNASVALQQITGLSMAATKVDLRYLAGSLWRCTRSPISYSEQIHESSPFMRNRIATQLMDVQRRIDNIMLNPSPLQRAESFAKEHAYFMQTGMQSMVDTITWAGAYEQATEAGADERDAVRQADSAVRETQGSFAPEDISRIEAGTPFTRCFTMFYSFFNMAANLLGTEFSNTMQQGGLHAGGRALYIYTFGFLIPSVLAEGIVQAMAGQLFDDDDDDGYLDNLLNVFFLGQAKMATAMVPGIGAAIQAGINEYDDKWYNDAINLSPAVSTMASVAKTAVGYPAYELIANEDVRAKGQIKDILTAVGMATGLPLAPLAKPIGYMTDIKQGFIEDPGNPVEFTRGLVSGRAPE